MDLTILEHESSKPSNQRDYWQKMTEANLKEKNQWQINLYLACPFGIAGMNC